MGSKPVPSTGIGEGPGIRATPGEEYKPRCLL